MSLVVEGVDVSYGEIIILRNVGFSVRTGESVALTGPSGTGKSSLLACITGLMVPTRGEISLDQVRVDKLPVTGRADLRWKSMGLLYQDSELLEELSVIENVALVEIFDGVSRAAALQTARERLAEVGLADHADKRIDEISGGQAQRAALARALNKDEMVLFVADEPTASLDSRTAGEMTDLLLERCAARGVAVLLATHDTSVAGRCDRTLWLPDLQPNR